jgi:uncharacterized protein (DUF488 family)
MPLAPRLVLASILTSINNYCAMAGEIYTIGHSTHPAETFLAMLRSFGITVLADIRNFPGSRRYPHFNKENLENFLSDNGIKYIHLKDLGGRRKPQKDSKNTAWRVEAFRGYADYMATEPFKMAAEKLMEAAERQKVAYMCSEAVWWSCHRALVSDYLKVRGWRVMHIMGEGKATEHPYTKPARIINGELIYSEKDIFTE